MNDLIRTCLAAFGLVTSAPSFVPGVLQFQEGVIRPSVEASKSEGDTIVYPDGMRVRILSSAMRRLRAGGEIQGPGGFDRNDPDLSLVFSTGDEIELERTSASGRSVTRFALQNRDLRQYQRYFFPSAWTEPSNLVGERILDVGCGTHAIAVEQWRAKGVDAFGLDVYLTRKLRDQSHLAMADALNTGLASGQFHRIYAAYGPLSYSDVPLEQRAQMLKEMFRLLRKGGSIRLSPADPDDLGQLVRASQLKLRIVPVEEGRAFELLR